MKGFKLDEYGDIEILSGHIQLINGAELLKQTVEKVLNTSKGEWLLNTTEGINYNSLITKKPDFDYIKAEIIDALHQVDNTFILTDYKYNFDKSKRKLIISFAAQNSDGKYISSEQFFA